MIILLPMKSGIIQLIQQENVLIIKKIREARNEKLKKRVSFNPRVKIINIIKYKNETRRKSYECYYSDSSYEDDFNDEIEKKCILYFIF